MTFRARLVLTATAAVLVVVILGSLATYVVAYNSLVGSIDVTLSQTAHALITVNNMGNTCTTVAGQCSQVVLPGGATNPGDPVVLSIPDVVKSAGDLPRPGKFVQNGSDAL